MIRFFAEGIDFKPKGALKVKRWLKAVVFAEDFKMGDLNYIFCSDTYLHQINIDYLKHDTFTDIITFDNSEDEAIIEGDIFVSVERVRENAQKFAITFEQELNRVLVHGLLHLCGYFDKTIVEQQTMRQKENNYLAMYDEFM